LVCESRKRFFDEVEKDFHLQGKCGIAYGDPGVGKTMACQEYARKNPDAIVFELPTNASSIERVNDYLTDALKVKVDRQRFAFDEIVSRLTRKSFLLRKKPLAALTDENRVRCRRFADGEAGAL
jgi:DNA transposition AAA+ family ATPase